jgi:hypothetical protein
MLGVAPRLAEDVLHSERAAKAVLTRRNLFVAAGAMAAGTVLAPGADLVAAPQWYAVDLSITDSFVSAVLARAEVTVFRPVGNQTELQKRVAMFLKEPVW